MAKDRLTTYRRKRSFAATAEPPGKPGAGGGTALSAEDRPQLGSPS